MSVNSIVRMSLEEARAKRDRGETRTRKDAPIGPSLGPDFWADAVVAQSGGKGHIKKMQQVLKAYVDAHK